MPSIELRPRTGTEIVDAAFQLYRRHFNALVTISAVALAPLIALSLLWTGGDQTIQATRPVAAFSLLFLAWIFSTISEAAVVLAVSDGVLQGVVDVGTTLRRTLKRIMTLLIAAWLKWFIILFGIGVAVSIAAIAAAAIGGGTLAATGAAPSGAVALGFVMLIVALVVGGGVGLFYYACYFAVSPAVMIEGCGAGASLSRSRQLSRGLRRKVLSTLGTPMLILTVLQLILSALAQSLPGPAAIGFLIQQTLTIVLSPIVAVIATLLYYDARIRNEGYDIEVMAAELGEATTSTAPNP